MDININDIATFCAEIGALVFVGLWARHVTPGNGVIRTVAGIVVVVAAMVLWGLFAAPKSTFDNTLALVLVKVLVLGGSVVAAFALVTWPWAALWGVAVAVTTTLTYVGPLSH